MEDTSSGPTALAAPALLLSIVRIVLWCKFSAGISKVPQMASAAAFE